MVDTPAPVERKEEEMKGEEQKKIEMEETVKVDKNEVPVYDDRWPEEAPLPVMRPSLKGRRATLEDFTPTLEAPDQDKYEAMTQRILGLVSARAGLEEEEEAYKMLSQRIDALLQSRKQLTGGKAVGTIVKPTERREAPITIPALLPSTSPTSRAEVRGLRKSGKKKVDKDEVPVYDDRWPEEAPPPVMRPSLKGRRATLENFTPTLEAPDEDKYEAMTQRILSLVSARAGLEEEEEAYKMLSQRIDALLQSRKQLTGGKAMGTIVKPTERREAPITIPTRLPSTPPTSRAEGGGMRKSGKKKEDKNTASPSAPIPISRKGPARRENILPPNPSQQGDGGYGPGKVPPPQRGIMRAI